MARTQGTRKRIGCEAKTLGKREQGLLNGRVFLTAGDSTAPPPKLRLWRPPAPAPRVVGKDRLPSANRGPMGVFLSTGMEGLARCPGTPRRVTSSPPSSRPSASPVTGPGGPAQQPISFSPAPSPVRVLRPKPGWALLLPTSTHVLCLLLLALPAPVPVVLGPVVLAWQGRARDGPPPGEPWRLAEPPPPAPVHGSGSLAPGEHL